MNIVYWFTFNQRIKDKTPPYFYIGSKHNCLFKNGVIIDSQGREYWSSCKQPLFLSALSERPSVKILHSCEDVLSEEERYHIHYNVVKSQLFFNKATAKGTFKSCLKNKPKSRNHIEKMKSSSHLKGKQPWEHPHSVFKGTHLIWLNAKIFYDWYVGPHKTFRLGPKIMSRETGLECSHMIGITMINRFKSGWNPHSDLKFQQFVGEFT